MKKYKILICGSSGMAGHIIYDHLKSINQYDILHTARTSNDFTTIPIDIEYDMDLNKLEEIIIDCKPNFIINCIGLLINLCDKMPDKAIYINSYFPHWLEQITKNTESKVIHLSTDCVNSGNKGNYNENDIPDGIGFYARSKALGEIINDKDLTIRMSIIGKELKDNGSGLFEWFMKQKGEICGYSYNMWNGLTTLLLAQNIGKIIKENPKLSGLYHLAPNYKISKFNLLQLIKQIWNETDITIKSKRVPNDKTLVNNRKKDFKPYMLPNYESMLLEYYNYLKNKNDK